jgi:predicted O-methyltransferase YrrM
VELGTSLGVNTLYLAHATSDVGVWTFEGCSSIADIARKAFQDYGCANIKLIKGNIAVTLPSFLHKSAEIDFAFIDASHTYTSTMEYLSLLQPKLSGKAVVVIDDIYWSPDMTRAWKDITHRSTEIASIDIYQCGILLFANTFKAKGLKLAY